MRRLNRFEYNNTVRDLLGDDTNPANEFPPEEEALGFNNNATALGVTPILAERYMVAAEGIAARATEDLPALLPCDPADVGEDACARELVVDLGMRAFRRPLSGDEVDRVMAVYDWGRGEGYDYRESVELIIETLLQSPHFLYRVEFGAAADSGQKVVRLDDWEMASRLSYMLWGTMPDDALFAAAAAGELSEPAQIRAQAERMLADPRARHAVRDFYGQWLELDLVDGMEKDADIYPQYTPEIRALLRAETEAFVDHVIWDGDGSVESLLTAGFSFMNAELAAFYGIEGPGGADFERVQLPDGQRAGLLTHAGFLAAQAKPNQSSPIHRGKFVREQLLCQLLPPPPDDIAIVPPDLDPDLTTRERFSEHSNNEACRGCHELIDPIGFGFEAFDGMGIYRAEENGKPIDVSGELIATDVDGPFSGVPELASKLATSEQVHNCVVTQYFRYGYGRAETDDDICTVAPLMGDFAEGGNLRELILAFTQTDAFLYRNAVVAE